jgi:hypothetical protein
VRALLGRERFDREMAEELRFHLEKETEAHMRAGMDAAAARRAARLAFGAVDSVRESVREESGWSWLDDLRVDGRFAVRSLARNPVFAAVAIVTLGLGIGAATAVYSVVDGVLLRPLPWVDEDRVAMIWELDRISGTEREAASVPDFIDFQEQSESFAVMAALDDRPVNLSLPGQEPERIRVAEVTGEFFNVLGVTPRIGRFFDDPDGSPVAVISEELWQSRLGAEPCWEAR